jgi:hypothetical protein
VKGTCVDDVAGRAVCTGRRAGSSSWPPFVIQLDDPPLSACAGFPTIPTAPRRSLAGRDDGAQLLALQHGSGDLREGEVAQPRSITVTPARLRRSAALAWTLTPRSPPRLSLPRRRDRRWRDAAGLACSQSTGFHLELPRLYRTCQTTTTAISIDSPDVHLRLVRSASGRRRPAPSMRGLSSGTVGLHGAAVAEESRTPASLGG